MLVVAAWSLAGARGELEDARRHAAAGRAYVRDMDLEAARTSFAAAASSFDRGAAALHNPAVRVVVVVPVVRENLRAARAMAVAGGIVADAGADLLATVNRQPDGLRSYLPSGGRVPVDRLARNAATAERRLADAAATAGSVSADRLIGPVRSAWDQFDDELMRSQALVGSAADASRAFTDLLGGNGRRRYLFGAQNPAELRGTGGYSGAYAVATFDRGRFRLSRFVPIQSMRSVPLSQAPPPSRDYAARPTATAAPGSGLRSTRRRTSRRPPRPWSACTATRRASTWTARSSWIRSRSRHCSASSVTCGFPVSGRSAPTTWWPSSATRPMTSSRRRSGARRCSARLPSARCASCSTRHARSTPNGSSTPSRRSVAIATSCSTACDQASSGRCATSTWQERWLTRRTTPCRSSSTTPRRTRWTSTSTGRSTTVCVCDATVRRQRGCGSRSTTVRRRADRAAMCSVRGSMACGRATTAAW